MSRKIENAIILKAAIEVAKEDGFDKLSRNAIVEKAGVSAGRVSQAYGTMNKLKRAVMRHAVQHKILEVIAVGLGIQDKTAMKAPAEVKRLAPETLI